MRKTIEVPITIRFTKFNHKKLKAIAEATGRSINFLTNIFVLRADAEQIIKDIIEGELF